MLGELGRGGSLCTESWGGGGGDARGQCASEPDFLSLSDRNACIHHISE